MNFQKVAASFCHLISVDDTDEDTFDGLIAENPDTVKQIEERYQLDANEMLLLIALCKALTSLVTSLPDFSDEEDEEEKALDAIK